MAGVEEMQAGVLQFGEWLDRYEESSYGYQHHRW